MKKNTFIVQKKKRWFYLGISVVLLLFLGLIYAWSVFRVPLEQEFGWSKADTTITFSISMMMFCLGGLASGIVTEKKGVRCTLTACALFLAAGFAAASQIQSLLGIYMTYGVLCGFGVGLGYNAAISTAVQWFPDKRGLISGIALMGFGFGSMVLGTVGAGLIVALGWRTTFILFGIAFGVIMLAGAWILRPVDKAFLQRLSANLDEQHQTLEEIEYGQMLRRRNFWLYFFWAVLLSAAGLSVLSISAAYAGTFLGGDLTQAAAVAGIISIANGAGRVLFGQLFDSKGFRLTMVSVCLLFLAAGGTLITADMSGSLSVLFGAFVLIGLAYGGVTPTNSAYTAYFFGQRHYALNFSITNLNLIAASYMGPMCANGRPVTAFIAILIFAGAGIFLTLLIREKAAPFVAAEGTE